MWDFFETPSGGFILSAGCAWGCPVPRGTGTAAMCQDPGGERVGGLGEPTVPVVARQVWTPSQAGRNARARRLPRICRMGRPQSCPVRCRAWDHPKSHHEANTLPTRPIVGREKQRPQSLPAQAPVSQHRIGWRCLLRLVRRRHRWPRGLLPSTCFFSLASRCAAG